MKLNSQAQVILNTTLEAEAHGMPSSGELGAVVFREFFKTILRSYTPDPPDIASVEDIFIPGPGGDKPARYYRPMGSNSHQVLPVLICYHRGGWMVDDLDTHDVICRMLGNRGEFSVVNVDYRLAPENNVQLQWKMLERLLNGRHVVRLV